MNRCHEIMEYLAAYADGELEGDLCKRVEKHIEQCERCRSESVDLGKVAQLYRSCSVPEVAQRDWGRVSLTLEACLAEQREPGEHILKHSTGAGWFGWWLVPASAVAAAALLVVFFATAPNIGHAGAPGAELVDVEAGPNFNVSVTVPAGENDFLIIDVTGAE